MLNKLTTTRMVAGVICIALTFSLAACRKNDNTMSSGTQSSIKSDSTTTYIEPDVEKAIEQVAKLGEDYGYENALSELTEKNTTI